ncbi:site-2 protease family protein [Planctomonas sp. JC2975]|uniref:M50 family metallopeptidase n=1 Tax=Planctomonas sp. JC2975 TaxID=2729626 RepID=UPI001475613D|nr:site-2 protease family protein [Planctomonas sp. JC2975]
MSSVLPFIVGVLIFVVGLAVSIALHELGHLTAAKAFGVKVTQYMIGFGKTLFSFRRGETEYGVKALPFGGYIAMIGMFPPRHPGEAPRDASTGFYNSLVVTDGAIGAPREEREQQRRSVLGTMADEARQASAETIPEGEEHRAFYLLHPLKRIIVMFAGPFMNLVIAFVLIAIMLCGIGVQGASTTVQSVSECLKPATSTSTTCSTSDPASPAAAAGFKSGDRVVEYDGTAITDWTQLSTKIQGSAGRTVPVVVVRDGRRVTLQVTPKQTQAEVSDASGATVVKNVGMIGIAPTTELQPQSFGTAVATTGQQLGQVAGVVINLPQRMVGVWNAAFGPDERSASSPVGIIGVGRMAGEIADSSSYAFVSKIQLMLSLLASLNLALFVFNMIPLLPLDGGHIAGAIWEWIKRGWFAATRRGSSPKPVDMARLMPLTYAVIIVLGAMSLLLAYADIVKPISLPG